MPKTTLNKCPACGGEVFAREISGYKPAIFMVDCENCKMCGPWKLNPEEAARAWNEATAPKVAIDDLIKERDAYKAQVSDFTAAFSALTQKYGAWVREQGEEIAFSTAMAFGEEWAAVQDVIYGKEDDNA